MKQKRRVAQRMERAMDFPSGTLTGASFMEIEDNTRAVISGCRGIRAYTEDCIRLRTHEGVVSFYGCELEISCLSVDGAIVTGCLQRIEFQKGGD